MAARQRLRALGLVPGAAGIRSALDEFRVGGPGLVTALNTDLLRCAAGLLGEDEEVLRIASLGEVVKQCLQLCDEEERSSASNALFVAALARACESLDNDSPFYASGRFGGFHRALANTWRELYSWGLDGEALRRAAESCGAETAAKLNAMALLEREATGILRDLGAETWSGEIERCLECKPGKGSKLPRVLVLAGAALEPLTAHWLSWLAENGGEVFVAVEKPLNDVELFSSAGKFLGLLGIDGGEGDNGGPQSTFSAGQFLGAPDHRLEGDATLEATLADALFSERKATTKPFVRIHSCADPLAEAEWTMRGCLEDNRAGMAWNEIAIYCRNLDSYACPLEASAKRLGVPLRISRRVPVLTNRFARLVLEALEFCASDDPRLIIPLLNCTYLGLDQKTATEVRIEARGAYKAKRNAWPVFMGFAERVSADLPWLARMLAWRDDAMKNPQSLRAWSARLQALIDILPWHGNSAEGPSRVRDMRIPSALRRAIRNLASVRAMDQDRSLSLSEFAATCREVWNEEQYSIPSTGDGVQVVNSAQSFGEVRSVYAIGMLEGVFPRRRTEDPILTDEDREQLSRALSLNPPLMNSLDYAAQERDEFYRLCAAPSECLTLSYPQADDSRDNVPAFYLIEAERAAAQVTKQDFPRVPFAPVSDDVIAPADRNLREALDGPREQALPVEFITPAARARFAWPSDAPFAPRELRDVLRCEFQQFARSRLGLRGNQESNRWMRLQGMPRKVKLLQQADQAAARSALEAAMEAEIDEVYGEIPEWELAMLKSGGKRLISEWIEREFGARKIWPKEAESIKADLPFGAPGIRDKMPGEVTLEGQVAAVSRLGPYSVTHLFEYQPPALPTKTSISGGPLDDLDMLYYGLHFLSRFQSGVPTAIEVESMSGGRTLMVLPRVPEMSLVSRVQDGLTVYDVARGVDGAVAQKAFFDEVKRRLKRAVARLRDSGVQPIAGDHCRWCGYGELCRRSKEFSEEESPFGFDENDYENDSSDS